MSKYVDHETLYNDLRRAVNSLHDKLEHPFKQQAVGYVLDLFRLQDENPYSLHQAKPQAERAKKSSTEKRKAAWEARRIKKLSAEARAKMEEFLNGN